MVDMRLCCREEGGGGGRGRERREEEGRKEGELVHTPWSKK